MPVMDLYDNQIMAMAINAAKDQYDKAEERFEKLNKMYGDFYSPLDKDMESWQLNVVAPFQNALDDLYARGIDPTRSAEGRALLAKMSRNIPYDAINKLQQSAKVGQKYLENMADLQAKGLYNPDYENRYLGYNLKDWDTLKDGVWNRLSPDQSPSLQDVTADWYSKRTPRALTKEEVVGEGVAYDPNYDYTGFLQKDLEAIAGQNAPGFLGTQIGGYYADLAKRQLQKEAIDAGQDPTQVTDEMVNDRLMKQIASANRGFYVGPTAEANPFRLDDYKTNNDIRSKLYGGSGGGSSRSGGAGIGDGGSVLDNHNLRVIATGTANLFGGKNATIADYLTNYYSWGDKMKDVELDIVKEITPKERITSDGGRKKYNFDTATWVDRHSVDRYNPGQFAEFMKKRGGTLSGSGSGPQVVINDELIDNLYTIGEVMQKNQLSSVQSRGKNRKASSDIKKEVQSRIDANGKPYMHSTGRIFTQVESDGRVHQYAEVYVKRRASDQATNLSTDKMYFDMGLESGENTIIEDPANFTRNAYSNFYGTNPTAESRKATAAAVGNS